MGLVSLVFALFTAGYILGVWTACLIFKQPQRAYEDRRPAQPWCQRFLGVIVLGKRVAAGGERDRDASLPNSQTAQGPRFDCAPTRPDAHWLPSTRAPSAKPTAPVTTWCRSEATSSAPSLASMVGFAELIALGDLTDDQRHLYRGQPASRRPPAYSSDQQRAGAAAPRDRPARAGPRSRRHSLADPSRRSRRRRRRAPSDRCAGARAASAGVG